MNTDFPVSAPSINQNKLVEKLQLAVKQIKQLAKDKQQLIQVGNRLRAELLQAGRRIYSFKVDVSMYLSASICMCVVVCIRHSFHNG